MMYADMKVIDVEKEKQEKFEFDKVMKQQNKIKKEFAYLTTCDAKEFQSKFVLAQAKEVCKILYRLKFTPFKTVNTAMIEMLENEHNDLLHQLYITKNEYGEYEPDEARIAGLVLEDPDPEEFPESRK